MFNKIENVENKKQYYFEEIQTSNYVIKELTESLKFGTAAQRYAIWRRKILLVKVGWFQMSHANCIESSETK